MMAMVGEGIEPSRRNGQKKDIDCDNLCLQSYQVLQGRGRVVKINCSFLSHTLLWPQMQMMDFSSRTTGLSIYAQEMGLCINEERSFHQAWEDTGLWDQLPANYYWKFTVSIQNIVFL
jgi:hypothetical protein